MTPILVVAGLTLLASFLCSLFEAALYAIPPSRIELLVERGVGGARRLARLRADVEAPIAAILTVNTIAHTVGAAWCGAMVGEAYGSAAVGTFAAIFTVLVLAVTEIVPKSLGVRYAERIGPSIVLPLQLMIWAVWPIVWVARLAMHRLAGRVAVGGPSEDEVLVVSRMAASGGELRDEEHRWVQNALRLDKVNAGDLRTPRTVVETLAGETPIVELLDHLDRWIHSRVPVTEGDDPDRVIGLVHRREVLDAAIQRKDQGLLLKDLLHPIRFVPEAMSADELLNLFIRERRHMVAVSDEYGGFEGVVTLEDVLECLLGAEIVDEHDEFESMQAVALQLRRAKGSDEEQADEPASPGQDAAGDEAAPSP